MKSCSCHGDDLLKKNREQSRYCSRFLLYKIIPCDSSPQLLATVHEILSHGPGMPAREHGHPSAANPFALSGFPPEAMRATIDCRASIILCSVALIIAPGRKKSRHKCFKWEKFSFLTEILTQDLSDLMICTNEICWKAFHKTGTVNILCFLRKGLTCASRSFILINIAFHTTYMFGAH